MGLNRWLGVIGLVIILACSLLGRAQQYNFIPYSIEDGLAQSQVRAMYQDQKGYLWIGTYGGISRFDGLHFTNYSTDDGLLYNQINAIAEDIRGNLWLASLGGIMRFDGTQFTNFPFQDSLSDHFVLDLAPSPDGGMWLAIDRGGFAYFKDGEYQHYHEEDGLPHEHVRTLLCEESGQLWFGTRTGLAKLVDGTIEVIEDSTIAAASISDITRDSQGNYWVCTFGDGVFQYNGKEFYQYQDQDGLISNNIRSATEDAEGNIWFSSKLGASRFDGQTFTDFTREDGLNHDNLRVFLTDREGNLWIGTDGGGISRFSGEAFIRFSTREGLSNNIIMAIAEDGEGRFWYSTYGDGVCRVTGDSVETFSVENGLPNVTVWSIFRDSKNRMWFGTSSGVAVFENDSFRTISTEQGLTSQRIKSIFEDKSGRLWFSHTDGVSIWDGDSFTNYSELIGQNLENVNEVIEDGEGAIWLASKVGVFKIWKGETQWFSEEDGLSSNIVYSLTVDSENQLWAATSNGLTFFNGDSLVALKVGPNYNSNSINFMSFDQRNHLWLGTNNGIYELDVNAYKKSKEAVFVHYSASDGVTSLECNQNAVYLDEGQRLWFGTTAGAIRYDPARHRSTGYDAPIIHITNLRLLLQQTDWSDRSDRIDPKTNLPVNLRLAYNQNHLTFDYIGIHHHDPQQVVYQYKLVGFDEEWLPVTNATFATYSNLSDGTYTFVVRAAHGTGNWSEDKATFTFYIAPPFWQTWWFYSLCALLAAGAAFGLFKWQEGIRERKKSTQQLVYQSRMMKLEQQTLNASMNRHFIFNALNSIQYYINSQDRLAANMYLSNFAELIRKNLDSSQTTTVCLSEELERLRLYLSLEHMRFTDKFEYDIVVDRNIDAERVMIPAMLLQPYVENSIWHGILPKSEKGKISIRIGRYNKDGISFVIEDDGIGINTSRQNKKDFDKGHISKGMEITEGRINLMQKMSKREVFVKGPYEINGKGNKPEGTRVEIVLPIEEDHLKY